jgi:hypothetical protein
MSILYKHTVFYKIYCKDTNIQDTFISFTTDFMASKKRHEYGCNHIYSPANVKLNATIRDNGNWTNWEMKEIEKYPCNSRSEANSRLKELFSQLKPTLNSNRQLITIEERMAKDKATNILYRENNKDKITAHQNATVMCHCGKETLSRHMKRHVQSVYHKTHIL